MTGPYTAGVDEKQQAQRLARLRELRVRRAADLSLAGDFDAMARELARRKKALAGAAEAWERVCPPALLAKTALEGLARGVLTVRVPDAATRFELDRFLRCGGEDALVRASRAPLRRVRAVLGRM